MKTIRKSIYLAPAIVKAMHLPDVIDGGLSERVASLAVGMDSLYKMLKPRLTHAEATAIYDSITIANPDLDFENYDYMSEQSGIAATLIRTMQSDDGFTVDDQSAVARIAKHEWILIREMLYRVDSLLSKGIDKHAAIAAVI